MSSTIDRFGREVEPLSQAGLGLSRANTSGLKRSDRQELARIDARGALEVRRSEVGHVTRVYESMLAHQRAQLEIHATAQRGAVATDAAFGLIDHIASASQGDPVKTAIGAQILDRTMSRIEGLI